MKIKVSEASGPVLNWLVAKCRGKGIEFDCPGDPWLTVDGIADQPLHSYTPSTDWSQGGPIIERKQLNLSCLSNDVWDAWPNTGMSDDTFCQGHTPLIAAMRCHVVSELGPEVEVPDELVEAA